MDHARCCCCIIITLSLIIEITESIGLTGAQATDVRWPNSPPVDSAATSPARATAVLFVGLPFPPLLLLLPLLEGANEVATPNDDILHVPSLNAAAKSEFVPAKPPPLPLLLLLLLPLLPRPNMVTGCDDSARSKMYAA